MGYNLTIDIVVYYGEETQSFGFKILNRKFPIMSGPDAELAFNNFCNELEEYGLLGEGVCDFKGGKAFVIRKRDNK